MRKILFIFLLSLVTVASAAVRPYGAWGIFGVENDIDTPADAWWGSGYLRGTLVTMDWVEIQPNAPTNLANLSASENFNWTKLDQSLLKVKNGKLPYVSFLFFHGNKAPAWIYGNQLADHNGDGAVDDCPTISAGRVTDWGDWNSGNLKKPSYKASDMPDFGPGMGTGYTTPANGTDGVVPVIGCSTASPVARMIAGPWPDYLDRDYQAYFEAFVQAVTTHIKSEQNTGGKLAGVKVAYYQAAAGRSGDDVVIPRTNATVTYNDYDAYSAARAYYPHDYMGGNLPEKDIPTRWWTGRVWDIWVNALNIMAPTADADLMVNLPPRLQHPDVGFTTMYEDLLARHPGIQSKRITVKAADFAQGEGLAYLNEAIDGVSYLLAAPGPRIIRGEFDESYKGATVTFDKNWATGGDGRYVNDRPEQELWWQVLQAVHFGITAPNWMSHGQFRARYLSGDIYADEFLDSFLWLNDHSGYKYPKVLNNTILQTAADTDTPASAPYAWIALREQPRFLDSNYRAYAGQARSSDATWSSLYNAVKSRGALADLNTLAHGSDQAEKFGYNCKSTTHISYDGYDGNFTSYITENNVDLSIASRDSIGWYDQGPISQRYGKYAKGFNTGKTEISFDVDNRWIVSGYGVKVKVTYLNRSGDSWKLKYIDQAGVTRATAVTTGSVAGLGQWRTAEFVLTGLKKVSTTDLTLMKVGGNPLFHMIHLERVAGAGPDTTAPTLSGAGPILSPSKNPAPIWEFSSDEAGDIVYLGGCASPTSRAKVGVNSIPFSALTSGTYSCSVRVEDDSGNLSAELAAPTFAIDLLSPTVVITAPDKISNAAITSTAIHVVDNYGINPAGVELLPSTAEPNSLTCSQTSATVLDCSVVITATGGFGVRATDSVGNFAEASESGYEISGDLSPPKILSIAGIPGVYSTGSVISLTTTFSEPVVLTDFAVQLQVSPTNRTCNLTTAATNQAVCEYRVKAGDTAALLTSQAVLGTIEDTHGNVIVSRKPNTALSASNIIIDTTAPVISEVTPVPTTTKGERLSYKLGSTEAGSLITTGPCSPNTNVVLSGENYLEFDPVAPGVYSTCTAQVSDLAGNASNLLPISPFTVNDVLSGLAAPTNLQLASGIFSCTVKWEYPVASQDAIDGFQLEINGVLGAKVNRSTRQIPCSSGRIPGGTSIIRIRAYNRNAVSPFSNEITIELS